MQDLKFQFGGYYHSHRKFSATFVRGINTIVGKNGSGKTSMIKELEKHLNDQNIPVFHLDSFDENKQVMQKNMDSGNINFVIDYFNSSEGEKIIVNLSARISAMKRFLMKHQDAEVVVCLFDALDSGLSINMIIEIREIFDIIIKDFPNLVIVNTTNNYEFTKGTRCISAKSGRELSFKSYDDYVKFILEKRRG